MYLGPTHPLGVFRELSAQAVLGLRRPQNMEVQLLVQVGGGLSA